MSRRSTGALWVAGGRGRGKGCPHTLETVLGSLVVVGGVLHAWVHACKYEHVCACSDRQRCPCLRSVFSFLNGKQQFPLFLVIADDHILII